jgi:hypothetical protein
MGSSEEDKDEVGRGRYKVCLMLCGTKRVGKGEVIGLIVVTIMSIAT